MNPRTLRQRSRTREILGIPATSKDPGLPGFQIESTKRPPDMRFMSRRNLWGLAVCKQYYAAFKRGDLSVQKYPSEESFIPKDPDAAIRLPFKRAR